MIRPCTHGYMPGLCPGRDCKHHKQPRKVTLGADQQERANTVLTLVGKEWGFELTSLTGYGRTAQLAQARLVAYYLLRQLGWSWTEIGLAIGGRGHSVALKGVDRLRVSMAVDPQLQARVGRVLGRLTPPDLEVAS